MCFDLDSHPPIAPIAGAAVDHQSTTLTANDGSQFRAFHAWPEAPTGNAIVILPDVRGLHPYYEELALRFAEHGVEAIAIDYFGRTAGTGSRGEDFDYMPHVGQTTWAGISADVASAVEYLRAEDGGTRIRAVFTTGFCFGGRITFLTATLNLGLAGAIGFYGWPSGPTRNDSPAPTEVVGQFECPILGIFGEADQGISRQVVDEFDRALQAAGKEHEIIVEPNAPHSFFDRKAAEFQAQSDDAWARTTRFIEEHGAARVAV